ncbi:hypothetical protein KJ782_03045, partial [Patescibacteria group bacterium]|nr:hypothetical protein [Patescibacteria group bacterium]
PLSEADQARVWAAIGDAMSDYDPAPGTVVQDHYEGNIDWYLRTMAQHLGVAIEGRPEPPTSIPIPSSLTASSSPAV